VIALGWLFSQQNEISKPTGPVTILSLVWNRAIRSRLLLHIARKNAHRRWGRRTADGKFAEDFSFMKNVPVWLITPGPSIVELTWATPPMTRQHHRIGITNRSRASILPCFFAVVSFCNRKLTAGYWGYESEVF